MVQLKFIFQKNHASNCQWMHSICRQCALEMVTVLLAVAVTDFFSKWFLVTIISLNHSTPNLFVQSNVLSGCSIRC